MSTIRLPQSIEKRLERLTRRNVRTKNFYTREAILHHLEELDDLYLGEHTLERNRKGEEDAIPLAEIMKRDGMETIILRDAPSAVTRNATRCGEAKVGKYREEK